MEQSIGAMTTKLPRVKRIWEYTPKDIVDLLADESPEARRIKQFLQKTPIQKLYEAYASLIAEHGKYITVEIVDQLITPHSYETETGRGVVVVPSIEAFKKSDLIDNYIRFYRINPKYKDSLAVMMAIASVLHEVGHHNYTDMGSMRDNVEKLSKPKLDTGIFTLQNYRHIMTNIISLYTEKWSTHETTELNIQEDTRLETKISEKYPGSQKYFDITNQIAYISFSPRDRVSGYNTFIVYSTIFPSLYHILDEKEELREVLNNIRNKTEADNTTILTAYLTKLLLQHDEYVQKMLVKNGLDLEKVIDPNTGRLKSDVDAEIVMAISRISSAAESYLASHTEYSHVYSLKPDFNKDIDSIDKTTVEKAYKTLVKHSLHQAWLWSHLFQKPEIYQNYRDKLRYTLEEMIGEEPIEGEKKMLQLFNEAVEEYEKQFIPEAEKWFTKFYSTAGDFDADEEHYEEYGRLLSKYVYGDAVRDNIYTHASYNTAAIIAYLLTKNKSDEDPQTIIYVKSDDPDQSIGGHGASPRPKPDGKDGGSGEDDDPLDLPANLGDRIRQQEREVDLDTLIEKAEADYIRRNINIRELLREYGANRYGDTEQLMTNPVDPAKWKQYSRLSSRLSHLFTTIYLRLRESAWMRGMRSGRIDTKRYIQRSRLPTIPDYYKRRRRLDEPDITFIIAYDISGSMNGEKIETAGLVSASISNALSNLGIENEVIVFDDRPWIVKPATKNKVDRKTAEKLLGLQPGGGTNYPLDLITLRILSGVYTGKPVIFLVSDGMPGNQHEIEKYLPTLLESGAELYFIAIDTSDTDIQRLVHWVPDKYKDRIEKRTVSIPPNNIKKLEKELEKLILKELGQDELRKAGLI